MPNVTRNHIFTENIYFFQGFIKIREAGVNYIKGKPRAFESRHCQSSGSASQFLIWIKLVFSDVERLQGQLGCVTQLLLKLCVEAAVEEAGSAMLGAAFSPLGNVDPLVSYHVIAFQT